MPHPSTPSPVRSALDRALVRFDRTSPTTFEGAVAPGPELVGPPGRLHGGLHPMLRLFLPLSKLGVSESLPLHVELSLRAAIPLEATTTFTGDLREDASGLVVHTRFGDQGRLDAEARSTLGDAGLEAFARDHRECTSEPEVKNILARGSVPMRIGRKTVLMDADTAFFERETEVGGYRTTDGGLDEAFAGVVLDLIGAVAVAAVHKTKVFTTHLSLDFHARKLPPGTTLLALSSIARTFPDTESGVKPVEVNGVLVPPTRVPVLLASSDLSTPFVSGLVTVVPVRTA
ncbi:MAG: hypothetical protein U0230_09480 [Polyangiales bacterium]